MWEFIADLLFFSLPWKVQLGCLAVLVLGVVVLLAVFVWF